METQTELFPVVKHIPQWLADYFYKANAGQYGGKQQFYLHVKPVVLEKYACFAGYDLQVINKPCHSCDGTGVFKKWGYDQTTHRHYIYSREQCWHCTDGIYETKKISLKRYLLNGLIYHVPVGVLVPEPHKNEIKGYITHENINPEEARRAYLILLWKYNPHQFFRSIAELIESEAEEKQKQLLSFIQLFIRKQNLNDELPF